MIWRERQPQGFIYQADERDKWGYTTVHFPAGVLAPTGLARLDSLRPLLQAASGCEPVDQQITYVQRVVSGKAPPLAGADRRRCGTFIFGTAAPTERAAIIIPGFPDSKLETVGTWAGIKIDLADPDVDAFVQAILGGSYTTRWGTPLTTLNAAYLQVRP